MKYHIWEESRDGYKARTLILVLVIAAAGMLGTAARIHAQDAKDPDTKSASPSGPIKEDRIAANQNIVGTKVFDETVSVEIVSGGKFTKGTNGKLIFKRLPKAPRSQIFDGFAPGDILFEAGCFEAAGVVPPEWWGANNTGDPTSAHANVAAINAALVAVAGSPLAVSLSGLYYVDGQICPPSGSRLIAADRGGIRAVSNVALPVGHSLIEIQGQANVTVDGIEVDGNRTNQKQDADHSYGGVRVVRSSHCAITHCKIHDCNGSITGGGIGNGVRTHVATDVLISDNDIYANNGCGINVYNDSHNIRVVNNSIHGNREIGIESEGRSGINYTDHRNTTITISGNRIVGSPDRHQLNDHAILVDWTDDAEVSDNHCEDSQHNGIEILGSRKILISGNHCARNGDVGPPFTWAGVRVTAEGFGENGRSSHVTIRDNQIVGSQYGIYVDTADHVVITGNKVTAARHGALMVAAGTTEIDVSGNVLQSRAATPP